MKEDDEDHIMGLTGGHGMAHYNEGCFRCPSFSSHFSRFVQLITLIEIFEKKKTENCLVCACNYAMPSSFDKNLTTYKCSTNGQNREDRKDKIQICKR